MGYQEAQVLSTLRIAKMVNAIVDPRELPGDLPFLKRTPVVPTTDGEIIARVLNQVVTADIIADDQASHVYSAQRVKLELNHIPKIKVGIAMNEAMIRLYTNLVRSAQASGTDVSMFTDYLRSTVTNVIRGVQQRMEALIVAMNVDQVSPSYSSLGIVFGSDVSWGMWSDLKAVSGYAWTDTVNATPVNDIWGLALVGSTKYGKTYDRIEMSTAAFRTMIATAEFQAKARTFLAPNVSYVNLTLTNLIQQQAIASNILGMELVLRDARHTPGRRDGGVPTYVPYLPLNLVLLSQKSNDNNANVMDWGNTMPTETEMNSAPNLVGGGFPAPAYGPIAYSALANPNLDPPGYITYGVARGFPRKYDQAVTAVLNIGTINDILSPTALFSN